MIQPDISWAGGFTECLRIAREAQHLTSQRGCIKREHRGAYILQRACLCHVWQRPSVPPATVLKTNSIAAYALNLATGFSASTMPPVSV